MGKFNTFLNGTVIPSPVILPAKRNHGGLDDCLEVHGAMQVAIDL